MKTNRTHHITNRRMNEGFTLIELMVSLSLFTIIVLAAIASLYTVNGASRKVQAMRTALDNLNFAIESMSRTIRTGTDVGCNGNPHTDCTIEQGPGGDIIVRSTLGFVGNVRYLRCDGCNPNGTSSVQKWQQGGSPVEITSPEIDVQNLTFYVSGADTADGVQPSVTMFIQGVATAGGTIAPFAVQTHITQRTAE
jgi:prepilin-type N-terminal cleavage/methylation domain-containing protein